MSVSFPNYDSMIPSLQGVRLLKTTTPASLPCFVRQLLVGRWLYIKSKVVETASSSSTRL